MDKLAAHLIEKETITGKEFMKIYRKEKGIPEPEEDETAGKKDGEKAQEKPVEAPRADVPVHEQPTAPVPEMPPAGQSAGGSQSVPGQSQISSAYEQQSQSGQPQQPAYGQQPHLWEQPPSGGQQQTQPPQSVSGQQTGQPQPENGQPQWMPPTQPQPENRGRFSQAPEPRDGNDEHRKQ